MRMELFGGMGVTIRGGLVYTLIKQRQNNLHKGIINIETMKRVQQIALTGKKVHVTNH